MATNEILPPPDQRLAFFRGFLRNPQQVGSVIPSSRFLERRVVQCARVEDAPVVVELGPGTGGTTRALLRAMEPGSTLLCIEINATFATFIQRIPDPRLRVFAGSAEHLGDALAAWKLQQPAAIVSGIPFSTMPVAVARRVLRAAETAMAPGGRFVAYQVRSRVHTLGTEVFGAAAMEVELLNIPPMRIYQWCKANGGRGKAPR
ncbi:MAG: hypothetical protein P1P84_04895 [Deferrisomatales bacterium]|nr:hypothetical protein [Deferrisomatales bacterium]